MYQPMNVNRSTTKAQQNKELKAGMHTAVVYLRYPSNIEITQLLSTISYFVENFFTDDKKLVPTSWDV